MRRLFNKQLPGLGWDLVDSTLDTDAAAQPLRQVLHLVQSDWTDSIQFEVDEPALRRLLAKHRITTLIPTRNVVASQRAEHRSRLATIYGVQMRIESVAARVFEILHASDIDTRVLKGLASAELDYPCHQLRQTGDVDLAVHSDQFDETLARLTENGYHARAGARSKGGVVDSPNGVEIDVHTRLFSRSRHGGQLFSHPGEPMTGFQTSALSTEQRLVHAAAHFILNPAGLRRLSGLVDVTLLRSNPGLDLQQARSFAASIGVESSVTAALYLEGQLAGRTDTASALLGWRMPDWVDRATHLAPERSLILEHLNRLRSTPREDRLAYLPLWLRPNEHQRSLLKQAIKRKHSNRRRRQGG